MIKQKTNTWGWHTYHSLLLGKQRTVNSRKSLQSPVIWAKTEQPPPLPAGASLCHQAASEQISFHKWIWDATKFFQSDFMKSGPVWWVFWARINITSWELCSVPLLALPHHLPPGEGREECHHSEAIFLLLPAFSLNDLEPAWTKHPGLILRYM